jgi:4'-phosphopantetheinyl transferase
VEQRSLLSVSQDEALQRFYWMWTVKEAYTKALGIGLGFDFRRVEYDVTSNIVRVDNAVPEGWRFSKFTLSLGDGAYQGVVAELVGPGVETVVTETDSYPWLQVMDAAGVAQRAIQELEGTKNFFN